MSVVISGADMVRALRTIGFVEVSQKGSHLKLRRDARTVIVPMHAELRAGTLHSILRQAGITQHQLRELL
jgi:predicted RNA binding protein YcfA (HicA-like mRNA interferase family)